MRQTNFFLEISNNMSSDWLSARNGGIGQGDTRGGDRRAQTDRQTGRQNGASDFDP